MDTRLNSKVRLSSDQGPWRSSIRRPSSQYHKAFMARWRMPKCTSIGVNRRHHWPSARLAASGVKYR
ncbi:hypothetical protein D3C84_1051950 [compost metagenome]